MTALIGDLTTKFLNWAFPPQVVRPEEEAHAESSRLQTLKKELSDIAAFLPSSSILNFDPKRVFIDNLDMIFDDMARSFMFDKRVARLILEKKGPYQFVPPGFDCGLDEAAQACIELAQLLKEITPPILDRNLLLIWKKIAADNESFPDLKTPAQIQAWISNTAHAKSVVASIERLDLRIPGLQVVHPLILKFTGLKAVYLYESGIFFHPIILDAHPNKELKVYKPEVLKSFQGLLYV